MFRGANPDFSSDELLYQLQETGASAIIVHPEALDTALSAARAYGISSERIILFDGKSPSTSAINHVTLGGLVHHGLNMSDATFVERRLRPGEAKTKLAFLSFSSGTTGRPKVCPLELGTRSRTEDIIGRRYPSLCSDSKYHTNRCS
jgi:long-subunit acyl-CoA synthetase (AMP-forming)